MSTSSKPAVAAEATAPAQVDLAGGLGTTYTISFDFLASEDSQQVLEFLQDQGYTLYGYKGATGPQQIGVGVPTWFAKPFSDMFGLTTIKYTPKYKAYAYQVEDLAANTVIQMQSLSIETALGTSLELTQSGKFIQSSVVAPLGSINVVNNRTGSPIIIGLAALVDGAYAPFCAFMSTSQSTTAITPHETVCLFAAKENMESGSVTAATASPGVSFSFDNSSAYELAISDDSTYSVISGGKGPVNKVGSSESLTQLLNS